VYCHDAPADCADPSGLVSESIGPEPDPGVPLGPGLGAPGGPAEGGGLPVAGAGDGAAASPYDQFADFKPDPSAFEAVADKIAQGKLPKGTVTLPYDPVTLQLLQEKAAEEGK